MTKTVTLNFKLTGSKIRTFFKKIFFSYFLQSLLFLFPFNFTN